MRSLVFEGSSWAEYEQLREKDNKMHNALHKLLKEMLRGNPASGTGKPEKLKHIFQGLCSRRLSQKDRLVYKFDDNYLYVFAIGGHYKDR